MLPTDFGIRNSPCKMKFEEKDIDSQLELIIQWAAMTKTFYLIVEQKFVELLQERGRE